MLMIGERLSIADMLVAKPGFWKRPDTCRKFLLASRRWEGTRRDEEKRLQQAELEAAQRLAGKQAFGPTALVFSAHSFTLIL